MDRASIIDMVQSKITTPADFNYDKLQGPPILSLISMQNAQDLHYIATSVKYSGKPRKKYKAIDDIMKARGFSKLGAGTNRVVYRYLDDDRFVFKIAIDDIGMKDNPREFQNQIILKPFCAKTFEVDPTGTIACSERVQAITNREEFELIASDVYDLITTYIIGKYIMADIGTHYFMNFGIRKNTGPVLLDYTYLYELDGNKLHCTEPDPQDPSKPCGGIIDYDAGFNKLYCQKCGHWYRVQELAKMPEFKDIINRRSETKMDVIIRRGSTIQHVGEDKEIVLPGSTVKIQKPVKEEEYASSIQVKPMKKATVPENKKPQTYYQQKKSEPVKPRFETKTDGEFKLKPNKGTSYKKETKPQHNNIQRGVVRTTEKEYPTYEAGTKFPIPQPSKKKAPHFRRLSYNPKFRTITMYDESNDRYVLELGEHDEIIQQIVDGSDYFKNVMSMKQSAFDTLKKNNTDLNTENEKLTSNNKTLVDENQKLQKKITDLSSDKGLEKAQERIHELEQQVLDLKERLNSVSGKEENPEYGVEEESFDANKYPRVMFTNGEVTTLKKLGRTDKDEDDHKVIMLSDGDIDSAAADDQGNMVLIVTVNGVLVDKYNQLKESEIIDSTKEDEDEEEDNKN